MTGQALEFCIIALHQYQKDIRNNSKFPLLIIAQQKKIVTMS